MTRVELKQYMLDSLTEHKSISKASAAAAELVEQGACTIADVIAVLQDIGEETNSILLSADD